MLQHRKDITDNLELFVTSQGYAIGSQTRKRHSLDSFVLVYQNLGGTKDNIKIEINYSLRSHVFSPELRNIRVIQVSPPLHVLTLNPIELFSAKINALLSRAAARDLYDTYNMIRADFFAPAQIQILRKCIIFYTAISQDTIPEAYDFSRVEKISFRKIQTDLLPVITKGTYIDIKQMKDTVIHFLESVLVLSEEEKEFLTAFKYKSYKPELLFKDDATISNVTNHPMALWKMMN
jgi:predicted nucleotidyltransferase component of viral defense system